MRAGPFVGPRVGATEDYPVNATIMCGRLICMRQISQVVAGGVSLDTGPRITSNSLVTARFAPSLMESDGIYEASQLNCTSF